MVLEEDVESKLGRKKDEREYIARNRDAERAVENDKEETAWVLGSCLEKGRP